MGISLDGLSSGLDTTTLISTLMQAEAIPQNLLKVQVASATSEIGALQGLNSRIAALANVATATAVPGALDVYAATSTSTALAVTVSSGASTGDLQVVVGALATSRVGVSAALTTWPSPPTLTIVGHSGTSVEINPASSSIDDVVTAINGSAAGVTATKVPSGTDPVSGNPQYRIQFAGKATGVAAGFAVYQGTAADVTAGTATNVLAAPGSAVIREAQDARITLWAGTAAEQVITSASNTFSNLLPGVAVTATTVSATPVTIAVARDPHQSSSVASKLVDSINGVFSLIAIQSAVSSSTSGQTTSVKGGVFAGDSMVRDINQKILDAATMPINGHSPSEYGISVTRSGTISYDPDKFAAALAADPATVTAAVQQIATRVAAVATQASDKYTGTITAAITGEQSQVRTLGTQVADWDLRLAARKATLQSTFSAMEVRLSNLKAQSASLMSQLGSLSSSSTGH